MQNIMHSDEAEYLVSWSALIHYTNMKEPPHTSKVLRMFNCIIIGLIVYRSFRARQTCGSSLCLCDSSCVLVPISQPVDLCSERPCSDRIVKTFYR